LDRCPLEVGDPRRGKWIENGETINNGVIWPVNMESLLIQSTIRVGFGEILVLTMVYTTGGSWKSIGWQLGRSLVAPRRARGDLFLWFSKDGEINWHKVNCFGRCFCTTFATSAQIWAFDKDIFHQLCTAMGKVCFTKSL
jgi:hypothetical protein